LSASNGNPLQVGDEIAHYPLVLLAGEAETGGTSTSALPICKIFFSVYLGFGGARLRSGVWGGRPGDLLNLLENVCAEPEIFRG
jgi:hypothetical protein